LNSQQVPKEATGREQDAKSIQEGTQEAMRNALDRHE